MTSRTPTIGELAGRLEARFVFVVGKGGVGKTTTAGALALACADAGRRTHLISTDPAHSVGDLFDSPLESGEPTVSACSPTLRLEEFDAAGYARRWLGGGTRDALAELVERGTYLRPNDVHAFLDLALPGIDEVAAAWRLTDLADDDAVERVVVDTAPTGHALRMLEAGSVARGWVEALDAMAAKAVVVASGLSGRPVRLAAEDVIDEMRTRADRLDDVVLRGSAFVLVTRSAPAVRAETERLATTLERRGLRIAARVGVRGDPSGGGDAFEVRAPDRPGVRGCAALRELAGAADASGESTETRVAVDAAGPPAAAKRAKGGVGAWLDAAGFEWHLFVGKGGVGKSTCATACALALAESRRVVLFGADPAGSLADVLGEAIPDDGLRIDERLRVVQLDAQTRLARFRSRYRDGIERVFERAGLDRTASLDRRVVESLLDVAPPGIDEVFAFAGMLELADDHDAVVVDAAPTGHFLRLLAMPALALDWSHACMRVLIDLRSVAGLDETAQRLLDFAGRVRTLRAALTDAERTAVFLVTYDDPLVEAESERLRESIERAELPLVAVLHNRAPGGGDVRSPAVGDGPATAASGGGASAGPDVRPRALSSPVMSGPIVGRAALREFFDRWEMRR